MTSGEVSISIAIGLSFIAALVPKMPLIIGSMFLGPPDAVAYGAFYAQTFGSGNLHGGPVGGVEFVFEPREEKVVAYLWGALELSLPNPAGMEDGTSFMNWIRNEYNTGVHREYGAFEAWEWGGEEDHRVTGFVLPLGLTVGDVYGGYEKASDGTNIFLSGFTRELGHSHGGYTVQVFAMGGGVARGLEFHMSKA